MRTRHVFGALAFASLLAAGAAQAASFGSALVPGLNTVSDDDAEIVIKYVSPGVYRPFVVGVDTIQVNDLLIGVVGITSFPTSNVPKASINEITSVYALQATSATLVGAALNASVCGSAGMTTCTAFEFGASVLGLNATLALANALYGSSFGTTYANLTANTFATVLEDPTADFTRLGTLAGATASASDGTQIFNFDLIAGNGDAFYTNGPADVAQLALVAAGTGVGSITGNGTISYQNVPGWVFGPDVTYTGSLARATDGPYSIWSNTDYTIFAQPVPEPATLALVGLGLAGLGLRRFKSNTKTQG